jgi:hypothetical protein
MNGKNQKVNNARKSIPRTPDHDTESAEDFAFLDSPDNISANSKGSLKKEKKEDSDFNEEFSDYLMNDVSRFSIQSYSKAGVSFEKLSETQAKISYSGLLAQSGAQDVSGMYGFGSNQKWENVNTLNLTKESDGTFAATVPIEQGKNINWAFRDSAENWDNNSGMNYTFVN